MFKLSIYRNENELVAFIHTETPARTAAMLMCQYEGDLVRVTDADGTLVYSGPLGKHAIDSLEITNLLPTVMETICTKMEDEDIILTNVHVAEDVAADLKKQGILEIYQYTPYSKHLSAMMYILKDRMNVIVALTDGTQLTGASGIDYPISCASIRTITSNIQQIDYRLHLLLTGGLNTCVEK